MQRPIPVSPSTGRALVTDTGRTLEVEIPPAPPGPLLLFVGLWLVGWAVGEIMAGRAIVAGLLQMARAGSVDVGGPSLGVVFLLAWFGGWTTVGVAAIRSGLWMAFGRETLSARADELVLSRRTIGVGTSKSYEARHIRNLRVIQSDLPAIMDQSAAMLRHEWGPLAFDYGADTVRFGSALSQGEADLIRRRLDETLQTAAA